MKQKRGFVVLELVIAAGLMSVLLAAAWLFFVMGGRQSEEMDRKTASLSARVGLRERLAADAGETMSFDLGEAQSDGQIRVLKMRRVQAPAGKSADASALPIVETSYSFDGRTLRRDGAVIPVSGVADLCFHKTARGVEALLTIDGETSVVVIGLRAGLANATGALGTWQSVFEEKEGA